MRVGLDYLPAVAHAPGVGRYARELVRALVRLAEPLELELFEVGRAPRSVGEPALGLAGAHAAVRVRRVRARVPRRVLALLHAATGFSADRWLGGVDVFHRVLPGTPPLARAQVTLAVGELPRAHAGAQAALTRELASLARVFAFSEHYARELVRRFGVAPERVVRVPVGADHWRRDQAPLPTRERRPVVLALGAVGPARRQLELLRALEELERGGFRLGPERRPLELEVVGRRGPASAPFAAALASSPLAAAGRVRWHARLDEPELARSVASAALVCQLDDDAGTAVTPLEALSLGTPVLASRLPALVEALDGHVTWVENERLLEQPRLLAERIAEALGGAGDDTDQAARCAHAAPFTWERTARATLAAWRELVRA